MFPRCIRPDPLWRGSEAEAGSPSSDDFVLASRPSQSSISSRWPCLPRLLLLWHVRWLVMRIRIANAFSIHFFWGPFWWVGDPELPSDGDSDLIMKNLARDQVTKLEEKILLICQLKVEFCFFIDKNLDTNPLIQVFTPSGQGPLGTPPH